MKKFVKQNWSYIILGVLVLVLFFLRFYHLTILPVFADEAIYIRWAQVMKAEETLRFLPLSDGKQPLFMWIVIPFLKFIQDPLFAGRFVSVLSGFGTLIGIFVASMLLFKSKKVALISSTIYAISPYSVFFDRLALSDSMLSMFGVWTFVFAYLTVTTMRLDFAMLAGFALGGAWLTKSPALFFVLLLPTLLLFSDRKKYLISIFYLLITVLIGYGMYNILRLGPNFHQIALRNLDYVFPYSHILTSPLDPLKPYADRILEYYRMMGPWPILVILLLSYFVNWRENWKKILVLSAWFLGPIFAISEFSKTMTARYAFFTVPFVIILASALFLTKSKLLSKVGIGIFIIFILMSAKFDYLLLNSPEYANLPRSERSGFLEEWTAGQGIKEISEYIKNRTTNLPVGRQVVVGTEGFFGTLPDGLQIYLQNVPQITTIGVGLDFTKLPDSLVESQKADNDTYLVVNKSRFNANPDKFGLELIAAYPKAIRPEGIKESNIFGPQDALLFYKLTNKSIESSKIKGQ